MTRVCVEGRIRYLSLRYARLSSSARRMRLIIVGSSEVVSLDSRNSSRSEMASRLS